MEIPVSGRGWGNPAPRRRLIKFFPGKGLAGKGAGGSRGAGAALCPAPLWHRSPPFITRGRVGNARSVPHSGSFSPAPAGGPSSRVPARRAGTGHSPPHPPCPAAPALPGTRGFGVPITSRVSGPSSPSQPAPGNSSPQLSLPAARSPVAGLPRAGGSARAATSHPRTPQRRGSGGCRLHLPPPQDPHHKAEPACSPPAPFFPSALPPSPGITARRGTKSRSPARSPPAVLTCCRAASSISASGGRIRGGAPAIRHMEARRGGGRAAPSSSGARLEPAERGEGSGGEARERQLPGAAVGVCPRLPEPAAALAHGQRCSGGRESGGRRMGATQLWVSLLVSLPSPLRGAKGGQGRGGWANKRLGDKKEVVAAAAARPVRRRLPSAGCVPHAWIVPASLLPPVPPSELGQAAPLSASAQARQHRRFAGPSPAACSPRTFSLPLSSPPSTPPPAGKALRRSTMITIPQQPLLAVRLSTRSPGACLPACLLLAAPSPPPVAPCRPHGQWERHGTVSAGEIRRCACE